MEERRLPTPFKVLAQEIRNTRHPYRVWPHHKIGDPCNDCGRTPGVLEHRHLEFLLWEAGLLSAEEVFDPLRGYWNPVEAQEAYAKRCAEFAAKREAKASEAELKREEARAAREEKEAVPWRRKAKT